MSFMSHNPAACPQIAPSYSILICKAIAFLLTSEACFQFRRVAAGRPPHGLGTSGHVFTLTQHTFCDSNKIASKDILMYLSNNSITSHIISITIKSISTLKTLKTFPKLPVGSKFDTDECSAVGRKHYVCMSNLQE